MLPVVLQKSIDPAAGFISFERCTSECAVEVFERRVAPPDASSLFSFRQITWRYARPAAGIVSYARLARFGNNVGRRAIGLGISPRQIVAIQVKDHIFHSVLALGLVHIGVATVSIVSALPERLRVDALLTDAPFSAGDASRTKVIAADISWLAGEGGPIDERHVYRGSGDDVCRIAQTSGSTGEAKAVGFTDNNQLARPARYNHVFGKIFPSTRIFQRLWLPRRHHVLFRRDADGNVADELYKVQGTIFRSAHNH